VETVQGNNYCALVCRDNHLLGAALFGDTRLAGVLKKAIENEVQLPELPELLDQFPELVTQPA